MKYAWLGIVALVFLTGIIYAFISLKYKTGGQKPQKVNMTQMQIKSTVFENNGHIPSRYTCDGEDVNPSLEFVNIPEDTQSLALIVEDPDAPGKTWVHWVVFNIDPHASHVGEDSVPGHGIEAVTDFGRTGYGGPCPPSGPHRYNFKLYALDTKLDLTEDVTRDELDHAMERHIIEESILTGIYTRE